MFQRSYFQLVRSRIIEPRRHIQVLIGPRQVGKSTLVGQIIDSLVIPNLYASADGNTGASGRVWLEQQWNSARIQLANSQAGEFVLAIDEIQKIEQWSEVVKKLWDEDTRANRSIKVILLGSSRLLIQQGLTESLAGRFETTHIAHWSLNEMREAFGVNVEQYVWFGGYPGAAVFQQDEVRWKRYVLDSLIETSISKDILMLTRVDKPALLRKLFELGGLYSGQGLSYTKMMGQLLDAGNTTTLAHYLQLLDAAGLLSGIEKFTGDTLRKRSSSPKFQVHNTALLTAQQDASFEQIRSRPDQWGRWVEAAVGAHLVNHQNEDGYKLHYWRQGDLEVDFVIERNEQVIALEVKSGATQKNKGMAVFKKNYRPSRVLLVGADGIPWQEFLTIRPKHLFD